MVKDLIEKRIILSLSMHFYHNWSVPSDLTKIYLEEIIFLCGLTWCVFFCHLAFGVWCHGTQRWSFWGNFQPIHENNICIIQHWKLVSYLGRTKGNFLLVWLGSEKMNMLIYFAIIFLVWWFIFYLLHKPSVFYICLHVCF